MTTFNEYYKLLISEGRPVTAFSYNPSMNDAYTFAIKIMRENGEKNAATYAMWDYIWRSLSEEIKTPKIVAYKKKIGTSGIKEFIHFILKSYEPAIPHLKDDVISALIDEKRILKYLNRGVGDRGSRSLKRKQMLGNP